MAMTANTVGNTNNGPKLCVPIISNITATSQQQADPTGSLPPPRQFVQEEEKAMEKVKDFYPNQQTMQCLKIEINMKQCRASCPRTLSPVVLEL
jgi:hypothetical protein